jgi:two-component system nitrate/nitrite response regulator NarL
VEKRDLSFHSELLVPPPLAVPESRPMRAQSEFNDTFALSALARPVESTAIRIIIADDDTMFRESLRMLLQSSNQFEVIGGCSDAMATLELVRRLKPEVLLLDYNLPREDGTNLLADLREAEPGVKVILLCHTISREDTIDALRLGTRGIVLTTEPTDSLIECIQKVVRDEFWLGKDGLRDIVHALCNSSEAKLPTKNRFGLTPREIEMIQAVLEGYSNPEIAANFSLSEQTVKHHLSHIFDKLGVYSRLELALFAVNHGINSE